MSYELVPLGELGEIVAGSTPDTNNQKYWGGDIAWITPADLTNHEGIYFTGNLRKITEEGYKSCSTKMLPTGSILFSSRAPIGHCAVTSFPLCTNQGFKSIIPNERLDAVYGFFALKFFTPQIEALGRGATFAEVNKEIFENFAIPLPPLTEQKRIASLLARADRLRHLRRTAHELGESLLQSVFLEMFGDPKTNPMGWKKAKLGDVVTSIQDGPHVSPEYTENGIPFLSTRNVRPGQLIWEDMKYISEENAQTFWKRKGSKPEKGDILYTKGGTTGYAKVVDFDRQVAVWVHIAVLKLRNNLVNPLWLENMLNSEYCYKQSQELTFGIVNRDFGILRMPRVEIYLPPLNLQEEFAGVVARVESLRGMMSEGERQIDGLFESLLAESFS